MTRLIRAQTADGDTIIEFLDDVMQDRNEGFKTHHRIAAAKELIVHIIRDEQPDPPTSVVPAKAGTHPRTVVMEKPAPEHPETGTAHTTVVPAKSLPRTRYGAGTQGGGGGRNTPANPAHPDPVPSTVEGSVPTKEPAEGPALPSLPQLTTNNQQLKTLPAGRSPPW